MHICVVAYKFGTEDEIGSHLGTYHYFIEKMRRVAGKGHQVIVVCPWLKVWHRGSVRVGDVQIYRYWPPMIPQWWLWPLNRLVRKLYIIQTQRALSRVVARYTPDVVYVWQAREAGYAVSMIHDRLPCPFVFRQITAWKWHFNRHVSEIFKHARWYQALSRFGISAVLDPFLAFLLDYSTQKKYVREIYRAADKVVLLSDAAVKDAEEIGLDRKKAEVIGVAIEEDVFAPMLHKESLRKELNLEEKNTILFIGRINFAEKGVGILLEAMARVVARVPHSQLVLIGGGEIERAQLLCHKLGIAEHVRILGKRPFSVLAKYINTSDVFTTPSLWMEAFGQVTIEAMSCGVPVVTSDAGASPEINIDHETGFVVPAGNSEKLAHALLLLIQNVALRKQYGMQARERVLKNYTYDVMVQKFITLVSQVRT